MGSLRWDEQAFPDPAGKIAELKYCAVKVTRGGYLKALSSYGGGQSYREKAKA